MQGVGSPSLRTTPPLPSPRIATKIIPGPGLNKILPPAVDPLRQAEIAPLEIHPPITGNGYHAPIPASPQPAIPPLESIDAKGPIEGHPKPPKPPDDTIPKSVIDVVLEKHRNYMKLSRVNCIAYYSTRVTAGLCSALLPFVVGKDSGTATGLAIAVAVLVIGDSVFKPRERWQLYSKATDLLAIEEAKLAGYYGSTKNLFDVLVATEAMKFDRLSDLKDIIEMGKQSGK